MDELAGIAGDHGMVGGRDGGEAGLLFGRRGVPAAEGACASPGLCPWPCQRSRAARLGANDAVGNRGVAHDLNNLLTLILGHAEMALGEGSVGAPLRKTLEHITHAADLGASLTRQWLHAGHAGGSGSPMPGGINAIVRNALDIFGSLLPPSLTVELRLEPALWSAPADPVAIEEMTINLLDNAREAMPHGGTLTVCTENVVMGDDGRPGARAAGAANAGQGAWVCLTVADTGVGMESATLQRLFQPNFTTKKGGTGLGLAVVDRIVEQHGGWVAVASEPGRGSAFKVFLPSCSHAAQGAFSA